jgi:two-component system, response regulator YesN
MKQSGKNQKGVSYCRVLGYFAFFLTVFCIILIIIYNADCAVVGRQYSEKIQANLTAITGNIDTQMQIVRNLGSDFFLEPDIIMYLKPEKDETLSVRAEQWRIIRKISREEALVAPLVSSVFVFISHDNHILTGDGHYDVDYFFKDMYRYADYPEQFWMSSFKKGSLRMILPPTVMKTRKNSGAVIPVVTTDRISGNVAIHVCNIAVKTLEDMFVAEPSFNGLRFVVFDSKRNVILDTNHSTGSVYAAVGNSKNIIFRQQSSCLDWTVCAVVSRDAFRQVVTENLILVFQMVFAALLCGVGMTFLFSFRIYKPVQKQYLAQEEKNSRDYIWHSVQLLLHGFQSSDVCHVSGMMQKYYQFSGSFFLCCDILLDYHLQFYQDYEGENLAEKQKELASRLYRAAVKFSSCYILDLQNGLYSCIFNLDAPVDEKTAADFFRAGHIFPENDQKLFSIIIGIGTVCDSLDKIAVSHKHALLAVQHRVTQQDYEVINFRDIPVSDRVLFSFYDQKEILKNIYCGNESVLTDCISRILDINLKRGISEENMQELYRQIMMVGQRCLDEKGYPVDTMKTFQSVRDVILQQEMDNPFDIKKKVLLNFFVEIQSIVYIPQELTEAIRSTAVRAQKYIDMNFNKPLCLEIVAEALQITPKYLSRIFKTAFGENFTGYTSRIRIEKAKILLATTNEHINDIALDVGMESRATFLRVFRKMAGISPSEYRLFAHSSETENTVDE